MSLTPETLATVNATAPAVAANISQITSTFYPTMFKNNPNVLKFFNPSNQRTGRQPQALADAVLAAVGHLANLDAIGGALDLIAQKHCALGVQPGDYKIVHDNFLAATAQVLGDAVTPEVADAWSQVLMIVAKNLIAREAVLYDAAEARAGGWRGAKEFRVTRVEDETAGVKSLYLEPADGSAAPAFTPGQYVSVATNPDPATHRFFAPRHYTISHHEQLRISPRLHAAGDNSPGGAMSNFLHSRKAGDTLLLHPPFGEFTQHSAAANATERPHRVFVAGGIGVTPCVAMAGEALCGDGVTAGNGRVAFFHASHTREHPLCDELNTHLKVLGDRHAVLNVVPTLQAHGFDPLVKCRFFVCGPPAMMSAVLEHLHICGIAGAHVHFEAFGPRPHRPQTEIKEDQEKEEAE